MNQANQPRGLRCHDPAECVMGQLPCPTPKACNCAPEKQPEALRLADELETVFGIGTATAPAAELRRLHAETTAQRAELVAEAARTAEAILRANQAEGQHRTQSKMRAELESQLAAIGAGGVEPLRKREPAEPSPTAGMNLGQRILHVGGRENAAGYIEFGSVAAVRALVGQVLRDLQAAPPAPAAVAVPADVKMALARMEQRLTYGLIKLTIDDDSFSAQAARFDMATIRAALAAAPAQACPSECDSPELCRVHRGCAGQYGTKKTCHSFAVLNPCNPAAPAQEHATQLAGQGQDVPVPLFDAQHLLSWMDAHFGNASGDDWFDADAASVADGLAKAIARFEREHPAAAPAQVQEDAGDSVQAIDAAAKAIAKGLDYPWEYMTKEGHANMHEVAATALTAARAAQGGAA